MSGRRRLSGLAVTAAGLAVLAAGCGGSSSPRAAGAETSALAYTQCMRSHGVHDFPDPTQVPGGGIGFQIDGGAGSDLNRSDPTFENASQACRSELPGGSRSGASTQKIAEEVKWADCLRAHGVPSFPDPNAQGAFDSSKFNESSPAFETASNACKSLEAALGAVAAVPGHG